MNPNKAVIITIG